MGRIVEGTSGLRYRVTPMSYVVDEAGDAALHGIGWAKERVEQLPHVPDWPIPGQAPQYLSDNPETVVGWGDRILIHIPDPDIPDDPVWVLMRYTPEDDAREPLSWFSGRHGADVTYLIQRADPEEDV